MKTGWYEDLLSLTPPLAFLITSKIYLKKPNKRFPYGYHRAITIGYLCSALALFGIGVFLLFDSSVTLIRQEHPTVGLVTLFGHPVWLGYLMIAALIWGIIPSVYLGKVKLPISKKIHDKNLYADAEMSKANWKTGIASIIGIIGIGLGFWWADAVAAIILSIDILHDGYKNLTQAVFDLMNEYPMTVVEQHPDPLIDKVVRLLENENWIKEVKIRVREEGHIYFGEAFVVPEWTEDLIPNIKKTIDDIYALHWRIHDFTIIPLNELIEN